MLETRILSRQIQECKDSLLEEAWQGSLQSGQSLVLYSSPEYYWKANGSYCSSQTQQASRGS